MDPLTRTLLRTLVAAIVFAAVFLAAAVGGQVTGATHGTRESGAVLAFFAATLVTYFTGRGGSRRG